MDQIDHTEEPQDPQAPGISRRRLIQTVGAGTAIAWAAPTVVGFGGTAMAASAVPPARCDGCNPEDSCGGQSDCGDPQFGCTCKPPEIGPGLPCICTGNGFCDEFDTCAGQNDCPAGYTCTNSCCGFLLCLPNCGTPRQARVAGTGARTDGK